MAELIHPYWIKKYRLDSYLGQIENLPAKSLLTASRFDLFAKLFYIRCRSVKPSLAKRVYLDNLRCFVPFGKEYGQENEKNSLATHIRVFNHLIDSFSVGGFDSSLSLVPVGAENRLLDGAHRVAALAYYDKDVTICRYESALCDSFDYKWFLERGMSLYAADYSAIEGIRMLNGMRVQCLWPENAGTTTEEGTVFYRRSFRVGRREYLKLRSSIEPEWKPAKAEASSPSQVSFIFFLPKGGSVCSQNVDDASNVADITLTWKGRRKWYMGGGLIYLLCAPFIRFWDFFQAYFHYVIFKVKLRLLYSDNHSWIWFYNLASPIWKRKRK